MKPGTRVVCIDDSMRPEIAEWQPRYCPNWVKKGATYTIRHFDDNDGIVDGVLLVEVHNPRIFVVKFNRVMEPRFAAWRFRELDNAELELVESQLEISMAN